MYRVITVEREFGSGAGEIARELANRLGWKLWDHELTEEIAKLSQLECSAVEKFEERVDSTFRRLAKVFWRGSYERAMPLPDVQHFDADCFVATGKEVMTQAAAAGNCVIVGRGAPYFLREEPDAFHVFCYAPRAEKIRRLREIGKSENDAITVDGIDQILRFIFVKHYFNADWPTRSLYHLMLNTAIGNENVISSILNTMHSLEKKSTVSLTDLPEHETQSQR